MLLFSMLAEILCRIANGVHIFWSADFKRWSATVVKLYSEIEDISHYALFESSNYGFPRFCNMLEVIK